MKSIRLSLVSMKPLANGGAALITRPSTENPSENGVHVMNANQISRLALRTVGVANAAALMFAINGSNGAATLTIQAIPHKAGDVWKNDLTGETGTYGDKNEGKDWVEYKNHEIALGQAVNMHILGVVMGAAVSNIPASPEPVASQRSTEPKAELVIEPTKAEEVVNTTKAEKVAQP